MRSSASNNEALEYLVAIATATAALGTVAAVLAALYFNGWRERRRRPRLSLIMGEEANIGVGFERNPQREPFFRPLALKVSSATGRRTAYDAEVLLTIEVATYGQAKFPESLTIRDQPVAWSFGIRPTGSGRDRIDMPPGVTRKLTVAYIGHPWSIAESIEPHEPIPPESQPSWLEVLGIFNLYPLHQHSMQRIANTVYYLTFVVTARDTDARRYTTELSFRVEDQGPYRFVGASWTPMVQQSENVRAKPDGPRGGGRLWPHPPDESTLRWLWTRKAA